MPSCVGVRARCVLAGRVRVHVHTYVCVCMCVCVCVYIYMYIYIYIYIYIRLQANNFHVQMMPCLCTCAQGSCCGVTVLVRRIHNAHVTTQTDHGSAVPHHFVLTIR
jgi:hypothetical protein